VTLNQFMTTVVPALCGVVLGFCAAVAGVGWLIHRVWRIVEGL
jgi:hypothetical protein